MTCRVMYWQTPSIGLLCFTLSSKTKGIDSFVMDSLFKDVYTANNLGRQGSCLTLKKRTDLCTVQNKKDAGRQNGQFARIPYK